MSNAGDTNPHRHLAAAIARVLREGAVAVLATIVEAPRPSQESAQEDEATTSTEAARNSTGAKILFEESGESVGSSGDALLDAALSAQSRAFLSSRAEAQVFRVEEFAASLDEWRAARVLFERIKSEPHIVVCGAGHVGAALARLAHALGYQVTLIDDRASFVARARFPEEGIELVASENWGVSVREVIGTGRGVYVAVVTRGHNEDEECMRAVLATRPDYAGMIGSRRRTNIVLERMRASGFDEAVLREVRAPVGLDIGAVSPEEVALAILAEMVAERRGGTGAPLSAWRRR